MELAAKCDDVIRNGEGLGGHASVGGGNFRRADGTVGGKRDATRAHTQAHVCVRARSDRGREPSPTSATTPVIATGKVYRTPSASSSRRTMALALCSSYTTAGTRWSSRRSATT